MEKFNDGQHREYPATPSELQGQRTKVGPRSRVGQECGAEANMRVPATKKDADISTTTGSAGPLSPGERPGADDKR